MEVHMKVNGVMEYNMVKDGILIRMERRKKEYGEMVRK